MIYGCSICCRLRWDEREVGGTCMHTQHIRACETEMSTRLRRRTADDMKKRAQPIAERYREWGEGADLCTVGCVLCARQAMRLCPLVASICDMQHARANRYREYKVHQASSYAQA